MKASVPGGAHMIKFFEGMCKMLPAVVSGRKGNIRNVQSTVAQKKGGLFHTLAVDIGIDGAADFFPVDGSCLCGKDRQYAYVWTALFLCHSSDACWEKFPRTSISAVFYSSLLFVYIA